jgi:hypothetical protein
MDYPKVPIEIVSAPTDWVTILAALFAAFFGAAAAFALNIFLERLNERRRHLDSINSAVYGLLMSIATLVNLKEQSLTKFRTEFDRVSEVLAEITIGRDQNSIAASMTYINLIFQSITLQDQQMNGVFVPWQEIEFPMMPQPQSLYFTINGNPELIRLIHVAALEMNAVVKAIIDRNQFWQKNAESTLNDLQNGQPTIKSEALVVAKEALDQLEEFRAKHLKKRNWYSRWFFHLFAEKETWASYEPSNRMKSFIPSKAAYSAILNLPDID